MPFDPIQTSAIDYAALGNADLLLSIITGATPDDQIEVAVAECLRRMGGGAAKPARKAGAARKVATDHAALMRANVRARNAAAKQAPAWVFSGIDSVWGYNPLLDLRLPALTALHGEADRRDGYAWFAGGSVMVSLTSAGIYHADWSQWTRAERDALTA